MDVDVTRAFTRSLDAPEPEGGAAELKCSQAELEQTLARYMAHDSWHNLKLRMPAALEVLWQEHSARQAIPIQRWAVVLAMTMFSVFFVYTWAFYTTRFDPVLLTIFMIFGTPGNTGLLLATTLKNGWRYTREIAFWGAAWHTFGMALFYQRAAEIGLNVPTEVLLAQIVFDVFLLGLGYAKGAVLAFFALLVGPYAAALNAPSDHGAVTLVFTMVGVSMTCVIAGYLAERAQRISWLRAQLLTMAAETDGLTGILNRTAFHSRAAMLIKAAERSKEPASLICLDVDFFKRYNDRFGHPEGDKCLRVVARELARTGKRPLDISGRVGGEEFAVFLTGCDVAFAKTMADDLRIRVSQFKNPDGEPVTISLGVAGLRHGSDTLESLVRRADVALYRAKHEGRNRAIVEP